MFIFIVQKNATNKESGMRLMTEWNNVFKFIHSSSDLVVYIAWLTIIFASISLWISNGMRKRCVCFFNSVFLEAFRVFCIQLEYHTESKETKTKMFARVFLFYFIRFIMCIEFRWTFLSGFLNINKIFAITEMSFE